MGINIAIDGPSGAGKSTLARSLAQEFNFIYVDTGAMYRCVGLYMARNNLDPSDPAQVCPALKNISLSLQFVDGKQHVFLNGEDVSDAIREHKISQYASKVSAIEQVRDFLLETQRSLALQHNVIMDGRDIGTVVLPSAQIKIFLTASPEERAMRRYRELEQRGQSVSYDDVLADITNRDLRDSSRAVAPLKPADDSILVDTTGLSFDASKEKLLSIIKGKL